MPAQRPRAAFEPLPPISMISWEMIEQNGLEQFEKLVLAHVVKGGKPLVIDGFEERLDPWTFTPKWLRDNMGSKVEQSWDLSTKTSLPLTINHYLQNMGMLTDQFFDKPGNYLDKKRQRIYLKDIDCPPVWQDKLREHIPPFLFYLNDSTGEPGGPGSLDEPIPNATGKRKGKGIARAGDLMSSLPPAMRAENLMCYIGHEGTYTPAHREMCASLGQNIMVDASTTIGENNKPERPGSSIWFMTETKDRHMVSEYWLSILGHDIEVENHFAQVVAWKKAPFKTYVVEQKPGDFILIPPMAPHQVWNRGTRTMKVAWNRTTVETLDLAFKEAIPNARLVCRDEQYKNKSIVYFTLSKYSGLLRNAKALSLRSPAEAAAIAGSRKVRQVQHDFKELLDQFKSIMLSEMFAPDGPKEHPEFLAYDSNVTCAYCRGNIFNRFLSCKSCSYALLTDTEEPYDVCMDCFIMGRSCRCVSNFKWVEQWKWKDLVKNYEDWRKQVIDIDNGNILEKTPLPLLEERKRLQSKTVAQVCQEQLKLRPWTDIKKPIAEKESDSEEEILVNDDGTLKKIKKKKSKSWLKNHASCHVCLHKHPKWRMAQCTMCNRWWCYGTLWRAHDLMPQTVMQNPNWECPHCRRACSTGACRKDPRQTPYEPKGTLLGHDTKKVADERSTEVLVDFSVSNLNWIQESVEAPMASSRIQRRKEEAERAKLDNPPLEDHDVDEHDVQNGSHDGIEYSPVDESLGAIDPALVAHDDNIDPALQGGVQRPPRPSTNGVHFSPAPAMLDGAHPTNSGPPAYDPFGQQRDPLDDHDPTSNFVAPSAVMYQQEDGTDEDIAFAYPDPAATAEDSQNKRKRAGNDKDEQIRLVPSNKRQKLDENGKPIPPKKDANSQFRKKQQDKALDDARREGRFLMVYAAMKGKHKIIKLKISKEKLAAVKAQQVAQRAMQQGVGTDGSTDKAILQSDVAPKRKETQSAGSKPARPSHVRYRVEEDEDFGRRADRRVSTLNVATRPKRRLHYEEIDIGSDEDEEMDDADDDAPEIITGTRQARGIPSYLARKNEGDEDLPAELPADWKDGRPRKDRRKTLPTSGTSKAQIRPANGARRPPRASTGNMVEGGGSDADAVGESDHEVNHIGDSVIEDIFEEAAGRAEPLTEINANGASAAAMSAATSAIELAKSATAALEAENRRAKLEALRFAENGDDGESARNSDSPSEASVSDAESINSVFGPDVTTSVQKPVEKKPPAGDSIFSRPGMTGKKIKIVSAAARRQTTGGMPTAAPATFTPVNPGTRTISSASKINGSANNAETATASPVIKRPRGRPPKGKPAANHSSTNSMVSVSVQAAKLAPATKASLPSKRGPGRPPKQPQIIQLSEDDSSDSAGEIPARAPVPAAKRIPAGERSIVSDITSATQKQPSSVILDDKPFYTIMQATKFERANAKSPMPTATPAAPAIREETVPGNHDVFTAEVAAKAGKTLVQELGQQEHRLSVPPNQFHGPIRAQSPDTFSELSIDDYPSLRASSVSPAARRRHASTSPAPPPIPTGWRGSIGRFWNRNKGVFLVVLAQFFGTLMNVTTRLLEVEGNRGKGMHPFQILFARMSITCVLATLYMWRKKTPDFPLGKREVRPLLVARGVGGFFGVLGYTTLFSTSPWLMRPILIKEPFTRMEQIAALVSLAGVVLIARPTSLFSFSSTRSVPPASGSGDIAPGNTTAIAAPNAGNYDNVTPGQRAGAVGIAMLGVLGAASAYTTIRWIGKRAHALISVNYFAAWCTIVSTFMLLVLPNTSFVLPATLKEWFYLVFLGVCGFVMQFLLASGLQYEKSSRATNMVYTQMLFALSFDKLIWGTTPSGVSIVGSSMILGSAIYVAVQKEVAKGKGTIEGRTREGDEEEVAGLVEGMDADGGERVEGDVQLRDLR
ncbi:hypothetical protein H2199_004823 [Coniosporium tulheliwenetii]|uniref:Uncharacterized protein n=1 Tax=Coniosporium tulheliwenetii TaxID=3383036 RepID=A0ACC2Z3Z5_9PEZI|nr:hypothetical protein H2199_004823 [Cladosporium sp. JES 115]